MCLEVIKSGHTYIHYSNGLDYPALLAPERHDGAMKLVRLAELAKDAKLVMSARAMKLANLAESAKSANLAEFAKSAKVAEAAQASPTSQATRSVKTV